MRYNKKKDERDARHFIWRDALDLRGFRTEHENELTKMEQKANDCDCVMMSKIKKKELNGTFGGEFYMTVCCDVREHYISGEIWLFVTFEKKKYVA